MIREWIYDRFTTDPDLTAYLLANDCDPELFVTQGESWRNTRTPSGLFMFYTFGFHTDLGLSETIRPSRQYFQVHVHDKPSDYTRINRVLSIINSPSFWVNPPREVIHLEWMETSRDLDDDTLGTITRYSRFNYIRGDSNVS